MQFTPLTFIILAVAVWLIYTYAIPAMPSPVRGVAAIFVGIALIVYLLNLAGVGLF